MAGGIRVAGLFAGIGGIELGFHRALGDSVETVLLCESWSPAQQVLSARFPGVELHPDVRDFTDVPPELDVLAAGFPCTDLSQAGRTAGINGAASGLVGHVFDAIGLSGQLHRLPWLLIENVPNMLALDRGRAMAYLIHEIEELGYRWAYRVVDSRFTGTPQRRRRVILLATPTEDPCSVLFSDEAGPRPESDFAEDAYGFYWTEGRGGLGWAQDAVPTLKGGSTIGIPSPPAIWVPDAPAGRKFVKPSLDDAEALQSVPRSWTAPGDVIGRRNGPRWKMVGNAVTADVAAWVAERVASPGDPVCGSRRWDGKGAWPNAAWGHRGEVRVVDASEFPRHAPYRHLREVVDVAAAESLSHRAASGFWSRLQQGNLGRHQDFRDDVVEHICAMEASSVTQPRVVAASRQSS